MKLIAALTTLGFLCTPSAVLAASLVPTQKEICVDGVVDKERLVAFYLDAYGLGRMAEARLISASDPSLKDLPTWQRLFADRDLCSPTRPCSKEDEKALVGTRIGISTLLQFYGDAYENEQRVYEPSDFLTTNALVRCKSQGRIALEAPGIPPKPVDYHFPFRVRGNVDGLLYTRTQSQFASLTGASVSFSRDDVNDVRTQKLSGVIGLPLEWYPESGSTYAAIIPYAGINKNITKTKGVPSTTSNSYNVGVTAVAYFSSRVGEGSYLGNIFSLRSDYLTNRKNDTELFSLTVNYVPVLNGTRDGFPINDFKRIDLGRDDFASYMPILEIRAVQGWFTDRGTLLTTKPEDYGRAGVLYGVALTSDNVSLPVTFRATHTYLFGWRGSPDDISYFKADLSWAIDSKKYFSVVLSYANGEREDTGQMEQAWTLGLAAKY